MDFKINQDETEIQTFSFNSRGLIINIFRLAVNYSITPYLKRIKTNWAPKQNFKYNDDFKKYGRKSFAIIV